jgi:RNA polymerase sigma-70 factor (ECF subfamily)
LLAALVDDPGALGPLYDRYASLVYGLALGILANPDEAQDLSQEVFLTLCRQHNYDAARGTLGAYLTTLTRSRAIDRLRRRTRSVRLLRAQWQSAPPPEPAASPLERVSMGECAERVRRALGELPDSERRALEMAYYQGLTQAEIADDLGAPLGTVKSWCRRGLQELKRALGDLVE